MNTTITSTTPAIEQLPLAIRLAITTATARDSQRGRVTAAERVLAKTYKLTSSRVRKIIDAAMYFNDLDTFLEAEPPELRNNIAERLKGDWNGDWDHMCSCCRGQAAVTKLLAIRSSDEQGTQRIAGVIVDCYGLCCIDHMLETFDAAVNSVAPGATDEQRVEAILKQFEIEKLRNQVSEACSRHYAESYEDSKENGESEEGGADAIARSKEAEVKLAQRFGMIPDRVKEIVAAAHVRQYADDASFETLLDDILLRLKNNDADNCDQQEKASTLAFLAYLEGEYCLGLSEEQAREQAGWRRGPNGHWELPPPAAH